MVDILRTLKMHHCFTLVTIRTAGNGHLFQWSVNAASKMILSIPKFLDGIKIEVKVLNKGCVEFIYSHLVEMKPSS